MFDSPCRVLDLEAAARCLRRGGVVIFPTETFYGLGCLAADAAAVGRIYQLKRRPVQRPLPLLAADAAQAGNVVRLEAAPPELVARFWPGPLTLLLPARHGLPEPLLSAGGKAAVRVSPHPLAARLAHLAGGVLTASSANLSGRPPARTLEELDPELLSALAESGDAGGLLPALSEAEQPAGGEPSTLAEPLPEPLPESSAGEEGGCARLRLLRVGAVGVRALTDAGFLCL